MDQTKGFRNEKVKADALEKLRAKLTTEELMRIEEQRKFDNIKRDSKTWHLALHLDSLRKNLRDKQTLIEKRLWNIEDIKNSILRCKTQIEVGDITETLPDKDTLMTEAELKTYIKHQEWLLVGEVRAIAPELASLRGLVGHKDLVQRDILTEEDFDKYYEVIEARLQGYGYNILY